MIQYQIAMERINPTEEIRTNRELPLTRKIQIALKLSLPIILAQITVIAMQYIDAAMVGRLGAQASASVGLVSSSIWLITDVSLAPVFGYSVLISHKAGANDGAGSRNIFRQGIKVSLMVAVVAAVIGSILAFPLPRLLGAEEEIRRDATIYYLIISASLPLNNLGFYAMKSLQAIGDTRTPGMWSIARCGFNIVFNAFLIYGEFTVFGLSLRGAGLGVAGAALGTVLSNALVGIILLLVGAIREPFLRILRNEHAPIRLDVFKKALKIAIPMAMESIALNGAQVASTRIVAPLGTVSIAANSFAVTAEAICYMPGYGLEGAATTLTGQSIGAENKAMAKSFAWISTFMGMIIMGLTGIIMYFACPLVLGFLTPVEEVRILAASVLRIELLVEPLFGASIVAAGALRGAGDTLVPGIMTMVSIWGVRITMMLILVGRMGLTGAWIAMACELAFRGAIFLIRLARGRWLEIKV